MTPRSKSARHDRLPRQLPGFPRGLPRPNSARGICLPFEEKLKSMPPVPGDVAIVRDIWNNIEGLAYLYIWHVLLSF